MSSTLEFIAHLDQHLLLLIHDYGFWSYAILAGIVFGETGLVLLPLLPGDSLLFVAGAAAAGGAIDLVSLVGVLTLAAVLGNLVNFQVGRWLGPHLFTRPDSRLLNPAHLAAAHAFYERHGGKTVILARFLPIIRTYAPFVAGLGAMETHHFLLYTVIGAFAWVSSLTVLGYLFGDIAAIKGNLSLITLAIIVVTVLPSAIGLARAGRKPG
ncbi:MAG: VTT domain-containing protein [Pseudomonadota bacterium]|nr:VTT domain-containing protein [Pseudomonadota bacterium]